MRYFLIFLALTLPAAEHKTQNVILVMTDGLRWQDVFTGADEALLSKQDGGVDNVPETRKAFWRDSSAERRKAMLPFLWSEIAANGQIFGNQQLGSEASVTNGLNFSYPGYNEILCGFPDPRINSNDKNPNPNVSVLEWLQQKPAYRGRVAAFGAWDVFPFILNAQRSGLFVNAGFDALNLPNLDLLNRLRRDTAIWDGEALDAPVFYSALEYIKQRKPRVTFLSLGETDEWAHGGRYDLYLSSARRFDQYVKTLWDTVQSMPAYRGRTTLILAVDHGRGLAPTDWKSHGQRLPISKSVWMAFLGPDTKPMGERRNVPPITQSQVAATIARLLGEDYNASVANAGQPIADVLR